MTEVSDQSRRLSPLPVNPKVAAIVDRLVTAIAAGDFLPGTRLPSERALAESLAVGRNTVRSALKELADQGLLETRRGRNGGAFVAHGQPVAPRDSVVRIFGTDLGKLEATIDAIALGYSLAAETAALRGKPENFERISAALGSFRDAVAASDPRAAQLADGEFHHAIIESAEQPMLHDIIRDLDAKISLGAPLHIWGSIEQHEPMQRRALEDHIAIFEAIRSRDRQAAFDLSYDHAKIDLDIILELLQLQ